MKIAILILAHKNFDQLRLLIDHLKSDFKLYIHINKKVSHTLADEPNVVFISDRYAPYWGSDNTPKAMLALLRAAYKDECDYFMIISGQDLPLASNREITNVISSEPVNYIYYHTIPKDGWNGNGGLDRLQLYWPKKFGFTSVAGRAAEFGISAGFAVLRKIQQVSGLKRKVGFEPWGGSMWLNLNRSAVGFIIDYLERNPNFIRRFKYTRLSDEMFFQSILLGQNYPEKHLIVNDDMRYIDWQSGPEFPRIYRAVDFGRCISSGKFFGRKFDTNVDKTVIEQILAYLKR